MTNQKLLVLAAAPLLALGVGCGADTPAAKPPATPTATRTVTPSKVPHLFQGTLYVGGRAYPGNWTSLVVRGDSVVVLSNNHGTDISTIVVFREDRKVSELHGSQYLVRPAVSEDGSKLAYLEVVGTRVHLVVRDLVAGKTLGRLALDNRHVVEDVPDLMFVRGIDDDGTAHYGYGRVSLSWNPSAAG